MVPYQRKLRVVWALMKRQQQRAGQLAKTDLVSGMVGEFPDLQGVMGEYYARAAGEANNVSLAVREHYQPRFAGDALPSGEVSQVVALADRLDALVGLFGINQPPTGARTRLR